MAVYLRERKLQGNKKRYYLDIYHNKIRHYEFLFIVNPEDNKEEKKKLAKTIARQREEELQSKGTSYVPQHKRNITLHSYFDNYLLNYEKKDYKMIKAVTVKLKEYLPKTNLLLSDLTGNHFYGFMDYLNYKAGLKGESPLSYYRRFKKVINEAERDGFIRDDVYKNVIFKSIQDGSETTLKKQVLNEEEIQTLFNTECGNSELKRAFLFCCYCGLGYAEIKKLTWSKIINNKLEIYREKTGTKVNISLSQSAIELIEERKGADDLIFNFMRNGKFISETSINKTLKNWLIKAKIDKHITFYCARHTFATRLLIKGANLKTVSDALAHKSTNHTVKYLNHVNSLQDEATSSL